MKAQWLERRSGNFPCSLTSIQLSLYQKINHTDSYSPPNKEVGVNQIIEILVDSYLFLKEYLDFLEGSRSRLMRVFDF